MGNPTWRYRQGKEGLEAQIFDSDSLPGGDWVDSPAKVAQKRKPGRPPKVKPEAEATEE